MIYFYQISVLLHYTMKNQYNKIIAFAQQGLYIREEKYFLLEKCYCVVYLSTKSNIFPNYDYIILKIFLYVKSCGSIIPNTAVLFYYLPASVPGLPVSFITSTFKYIFTVSTAVLGNVLVVGFPHCFIFADTSPVEPCYQIARLYNQ